MDQRNDESEKVKDIILDLVSQDDDTELDVETVISLADRIDTTLNERKETLFVIEDIFKNAPSYMILKSVKLLEALVKNCKQNFHYDVGCKDFQDALMKLLDRVKFKSILISQIKIDFLIIQKRGKKSFFKSFKQNLKNWDQIEQKALYLIQLWYDTFMMHEGEFPHIMNNYKILRKEGIKFPERDPNTVHMINFKGVKSPIFNVLEEQQMQKTGVAPKHKREYQISEPSKSDYYQKFEFSQSNLDKLADNLQILGAIIDGAQDIEDLQTEYTQEIVMFLRSFKTKIMVLNAQQKLDQELGNKKKEMLDVYKRVRIVIRNYEEKSQEIDQLQKVMQESAIEQFGKTNYVKKLKNINIAPPPSQGQNIITKTLSNAQTPSANQKVEPQKQSNNENINNQNTQKQQQNNQQLDLLDMDFESSVQNSVPIQTQPINNIQNYNNFNQNPYQNNINMYQNQQQIPIQNINPVQKNNDFDLFSDFDPSQAKKQEVQKQQDDFWDDLASRK